MFRHPNAGLAPLGRRRLVGRARSGGRASAVARDVGVSRQTAHKRLARARAGEPLPDRRSRPGRPARLTPPGAEARALEAGRSLLLAPLAPAAETGVPAGRRGPRDRRAQEARPVTRRRHGREGPGELVRVGVKRVARVPDGGGWRARGAGPLRHPDPGAGVACPRAAVDDRSRVAYAEPLGDERREACRGFVERARGFFRGVGVGVEGVMAGNGSGYRSREFNEWLDAAGIRHVYTRPYGPWQNGRVERTSRAPAQEWQYARAYGGDEERAGALPAFLGRYNWGRPHGACGGLPPMSRVVGVNNVMARNS